MTQPSGEPQPQGLAWPHTPVQEEESPSSPCLPEPAAILGSGGGLFGKPGAHQPISRRKGPGDGNIPARMSLPVGSQPLLASRRPPAVQCANGAQMPCTPRTGRHLPISAHGPRPSPPLPEDR